MRVTLKHRGDLYELSYYSASPGTYWEPPSPASVDIISINGDKSLKDFDALSDEEQDELMHELCYQARGAIEAAEEDRGER